MTDEEMKAIKGLEWSQQQMRLGNLPDYNQGHYADIRIVLNLIEKQSKEIEEYKECERLSQRQLKKQKNDIETLKIEIEELKEVKWYYEISRVPKDKIKAKIEDYKKQIEELKNSQIFTRTEYEGAIKFGQSLLEKE